MDMNNELETIDIKTSYTVSRVLRSLLDAVFSRDDEEDALSFHDKELLEDVLRYGTIAEVSRRKGVNCNSLTNQVDQALLRLKGKIIRFELELSQTSFANKESQKQLEQQKLALIDGNLQLYQKDQLLAQIQDELNNLKNQNQDVFIRLQRQIDKAHDEAEAYKAEIEAQDAVIVQKSREIKQLKATITKMSKTLKKTETKASERERKLKDKIESLKNLVDWYKNKKV